MTTYETLLVETTDAVTLIRLNRPEALNALNSQLLDELIQALDAAEADEGVRCVVLTGSARAFAAGADIKEMSDKSWPCCATSSSPPTPPSSVSRKSISASCRASAAPSG